MTRSESPILGPFLELSTANLHLNDLSVDQLAALWNVFTKVGDSLHKGRRLENFVWRAWHREAHLLPPDASWSDFADCTPLETPVLSRAGSISQSYHLKPAMAQALAAAAASASNTRPSENIPSDPESGAGWSDESSSSGDDDEEQMPHAGSSATARRQADPQHAVSGKTAARVTPSPQPPLSTQVRHSRQPSRTPSDVTSPSRGNQTSPVKQQSRPGTGGGSAGPSHLPHERKRNSSTSSAFGSRSRVRHLNPGSKPTRRSPISFQAALESLTNGTESEDLARLAREHQNRDLGSAYERRSFQGTGPIDVIGSATTHAHGAADQQQQQEADEAAIAAATASHSSAPAASAFEERGNSIQTSTQPVTESKDMPSSSAAPLNIKVDDSAVDPNVRTGNTSDAAETKGKKAKFFLSTSASRSFGDDDAESASAASVSPAPPPALAQQTTGPAPQQQPSSSSQDQPAKTDRPSTQVETLTADSSAAMPPPKHAKSKPDARHHAGSGLTVAHKNRSGAALHKHGAGGSRTRLAHGHGRQGSSSRLGAAAGLAMTKTQPAAAAPAKGGSNAKSGPSRARPKFTMGGGDDEDEEDEEEFTDDEGGEVGAEQGKGKSLPEARPSQPLEPSAAEAPSTVKETAQPSAQLSAAQPTTELTQPNARTNKRVEIVAEPEAEDDDEDGWSSDTSAEAEEERQKAEAEVVRRRRADEERQRDLFKKVPVRSASAADVRHLNVEQQGSSGDARPQRARSPQPALETTTVDTDTPHPIRGLLSSLFHPEQESRSPPGQLHGRPHASAADLRVKPDRPPSRVAHKSERRHRPPSLISGTPGAHHYHAQPAHQEDASERGSQGREEDGGGGLRMSKSAVALPVLNTAGSLTGGGTDGLSAREADEMLRQQQQQQQGGNGAPKRGPMRRGHSSQGSGEHRPGSGRGDDEQRRVSPSQVPGPMATPTLAPHRAGLPTPAAPNSPRTTRRNMLRDELSESLRQNLLWERQSRNRMLGIGANGPREAPPPIPQQQQQQQQQPSGSMLPPRPARRETVLGGNQLRPLTRAPATTSAATRSGSAGDEDARRAAATTSRGEHHSRSTSHLSEMSSSSSSHARQGSTTSSQRRRSQPYSSNETSDEEDEDLSRAPSRQSERDSGHYHAAPPDVTSSSTSSASTLREHGNDGNKSKKKKTMWPGGFPNYHQHGW